MGNFDDHMVRMSAFQYLEKMQNTHGEVLPWKVLAEGFSYQGVPIPLIGASGIWKPRALDIPISIATSPSDPYGDELGGDFTLRYRYQGHTSRSYDNDGLRRAMLENRPLIYFRGLSKGKYATLWPALIVGDDPSTKTFTVEFEDISSLRPGIPTAEVDDARRRYVTRLAVQRLHQTAFRQKVLTAYRQRCSICSLRHAELLDAAHIIQDRHPKGDPVVPNGLSLCKIHHAAFDSNILAIRPDYKIEIRHEILAEIDGPMLKHGLQAHHGGVLIVPAAASQRPDPERLEIRYQEFVQAS